MSRVQGLRAFASVAQGYARSRVSAVVAAATSRVGSVKALSVPVSSRFLSVTKVNLAAPICAPRPMAVRSVILSQNSLMSTLIGSSAQTAASASAETAISVNDEDDDGRARLAFLSSGQQEGSEGPKGSAHDSASKTRKTGSQSRVYKSTAIADALKQRMDEDIAASQRLVSTGGDINNLQQAFDALQVDASSNPALAAELAAVYDATSLRTASGEELRKARLRLNMQHYQRRPGDTGSSEVQIAVLHTKIATIEKHLTNYPRDVAVKRSLSVMVARRRKLLQYLKAQRFRTYQVLVRDLGIDEQALENVGRLPTTRPFLAVERDPKRHLRK